MVDVILVIMLLLSSLFLLGFDMEGDYNKMAKIINNHFWKG
jgi:hypothetical protein